MIELPKQLQDKRFRFIKIDSGTKRPIEDNWQRDNNYKYTESEFQKWLKTGESYGVACGYGDLVIVDIENIEDKSLYNLVTNYKFPKTFTVVTGSGGWHLYYRVKNFGDKIILKKENAKKEVIHYGEIQSIGAQCIGPGSLHPSGNTYNIFCDSNITSIGRDDLLLIIEAYCEKKVNTPAKSGLDWNISKLLTKCGFTDEHTTDGVNYRGPHPCHGSTNGKNFDINIDKGTWYCHRCEVGGDAVDLIAMLEKLIKIEDSCPTRGQFKKVFTEAKRIGIKKYEFEDNSLRLFVYKGRKRLLNTESIVNDYLKLLFPIISIEDATGRASHIYVYQDGYYKQNGENIVRKEVKKLFTDYNELWSSHYENEIISYIRTDNPIQRDDIQPNEHLVNINNGIYNLKSKKLMPHNPRELFLYKIPWNYRRSAKLSQQLEKFLNSTFKNKKEYINFSQELFGFCLYSRYDKFHGLFYLYGTGGNGKSVWLKLLETMLGENNVANKSISSLMNYRFTTALLYGKLLNSCGELSESVINNTDMLKRLTAGEKIQAEFKGKDGFDFKNTAKIITACNRIPPAYDKSDGWSERQYILPFLQKFRDTAKEDNELIDKLISTRGMEGLLVWAIDGLQRLLKNKKFTYPYQKRERYLMYEGNTKYFVKTHYERNNNFNEYITVDEIREDYVKWCSLNDIPIDSNQALSAAFRYYKLPEIELISVKNKKIYVRRGIQKVK